MHQAKPKPVSAVISKTGKRDITLVMCARLGQAFGIALTLIVAANIFGDYFQKSARLGLDPTQIGLLALGIILAISGAFTEIRYGGYAARIEEKRIRARLLQEMFTAGSADPKGNQISKSISLLTDNAERVTEYRQVYFGATKAALLIPFLVLGYVSVVIDPLIGITLIAFCPLIPLAVAGFMRLFAKRAAQSRKERGKLSRKYLDAIHNLVTIRLHGAGERIQRRLEVEGERNRGAIMRLLAGNQIVIIILDGLFSLLLICAAAALSLWRYQSGVITIGEVLSIILLSVLLLEPLLQVAGFFYIGMGGKASEKAIGFFLDELAKRKTPTRVKNISSGLSEIVGETNRNSLTEPAPCLGSDSLSDAEQSESVASDWKNAEKSSQTTPKLSETFNLNIESLTSLEVEELSYDYGRGEVLHQINMQVLRGEKIAIVGRSGAGKSTLLGLLRGALPKQNGKINLFGKPAATEDLRKNIACVNQKTWLFTGTIADNLRIGNPQADDQELWEALTKANLAAEVRAMPRALQTDVGEQGQLISGGQAQRLSLARAFLSGRKILILDEPTSQVDMEAEAKMLDAIANIAGDITVIAVTHRKALLDIADRVYEMEAGYLTSKK